MSEYHKQFVESVTNVWLEGKISWGDMRTLLASWGNWYSNLGPVF
jgi:hypothetical protein